MIVSVGIMYSSVDFGDNVKLKEKVREKMHTKLGVKEEGAVWSKAYKSGFWDGITDFYDDKEDSFHTGLLPQFLEGIRELQEYDKSITYDIQDNRPKGLVDPEDLDDEIELYNGDEEPITLRDYQHNAVEGVFKDKVCILNISTGGGKCLTSDSHVLTTEGYKQIKDIFEEKEVLVDSEEDVVPVQYPLINMNGDVELTNYFTKNGVKPIKKITTRQGTELKQTPNHPLRVVEGNEFVWKNAEDIQEGDLLVSRIGDEVYGKDKTVKTEQEAYVLGVVVADGYIGQDYSVSITNNDKNIIDTIVSYFEDEKADVRVEPDRNTYDIIISGKEYVQRYYNKYNLEYGVVKDKQIPECIMQAPKNIQMSFLSGYIECEGYSQVDKQRVEITSASGKLLQQIKLLLGNMRIMSTLKEKDVEYPEQGYYSKLIIHPEENLVNPIDDNTDYQEVYQVENAKPEMTFDVSMPETNSFISEGVVNHNTEVASGVMQQVLPKLKRNERIAFFCDSKEIINQSMERISKRLDIPKNKLGKIGDGKFDVKNKQIVFAMIPTVHSSLKDPKKGVNFTHKERVLKFIATEIADKFIGSENTRQLIRNYIKNCTLTTKVWESALEHLQYIAYSEDMTDKKAQMQLKKYKAEFDKVLEKKNKKKFDKYKKATEFLESVTLAIHDEAHSAQGDTIFKTMSKLTNAQYRVALTGTIDTKNKMLWQKMQALYSPKTYQVSNDYLINKGVSSKPIIRTLPVYNPKDIEHLDEYLEVYKRGIVNNETRNDMIAKITNWFLNNKQSGVLISVNQIEHGENIKELLTDLGINCEFTHGGLESQERERLLNKFKQQETDVLIASSILDQGVDINSIAMLVLAGGGKSLRQILQRIGRGLRLNGIEGNTVYVFDFEDYTHKYLKNHYKKRKKIYEQENFDVSRLGE